MQGHSAASWSSMVPPPSSSRPPRCRGDRLKREQPGSGEEGGMLDWRRQGEQRGWDGFERKGHPSFAYSTRRVLIGYRTPRTRTALGVRSARPGTRLKARGRGPTTSDAASPSAACAIAAALRRGASRRSATVTARTTVTQPTAATSCATPSAPGPHSRPGPKRRLPRGSSPPRAPWKLAAPRAREARTALSSVLTCSTGWTSLPTVTQNGPEQWPNSAR